jgi:hypothetical protein
MVGAACLAIASALLLLLVRVDASPWWRLGVFPLMWVAVLGFLQARAATCVRLAAQGVSELDGKGRSRLNPTDAAILADRAARIIRDSAIIAAIGTLMTLALP